MKDGLTVVLPAYSEGGVLGKTLARLFDVFANEMVPLKVVVVLDGPDPVGRLAIEHLADRRVEIVELPVASGKGAALRVGCRESDHVFTAFFDADLDIHPKTLLNCVQSLNFAPNDVACVYGSKLHAQSLIKYPIIRRVSSRAFNLIVRLLFNIDCKDSQTGVKVFRTDDLVKVMPYTKENRFLFDLELLVLLGERGRKFVDAPVEISYDYSSTINWISVFRILLDIIRLRVRMSQRPQVVRSTT